MKYIDIEKKCKNEIFFTIICKDDVDNVIFKGTKYELSKSIDDNHELQALLIGGEVVEFKIDGTCLIIVLAR